tara:strand:- start:1203 stop:1790 length:588 start_codon:yes stop_codon:yes gene_type:complete
MNDFNQILNKEWEQLYNATKTAKHPYHHFTLSNIVNNKPESRTIILRSVDKDKRTIRFNTDKRSPKYKALQKDKHISALFYSLERKVQLRVTGYVQLNKTKLELNTIWDSMERESKLCYMGKFSPSSKIKNYEPNIPLQKITDISDEEYKLGLNNFINIDIIIDNIDWLYLHSSGHKRIKYEWIKDNLNSHWLAT